MPDPACNCQTSSLNANLQIPKPVRYQEDCRRLWSINGNADKVLPLDKGKHTHLYTIELYNRISRVGLVPRYIVNQKRTTIEASCPNNSGVCPREITKYVTILQCCHNAF